MNQRFLKVTESFSSFCSNKNLDDLEHFYTFKYQTID